MGKAITLLMVGISAIAVVTIALVGFGWAGKIGATFARGVSLFF